MTGAGTAVGTAVGSAYGGPVGGAVGGAVGSAIDGGGGGGGGAMPNMSTTGGVEDFSRINISPVGINFGAIMQPAMESPNNGGLGIFPSSRWTSNDGNVMTTTPTTRLAGLDSNIDWRIPAVVLGVAVLGFVMFKKRKT